jgi:hypothetical protein
MVYSVRGEGDEEAWYIEYAYRERAWEISKLAGVARQRVEQLVKSQAPLPLALKLAREPRR